ncbi:hypothetical protein ACQ5SO_17445 [Rhodovulum sp. DZ06]|uniref:hypothetical protein n=1 Tax=Rhodovulum sp. DZ06 TaxID=3425126 RepID=UPI003D35703E
MNKSELIEAVFAADPETSGFMYEFIEFAKLDAFFAGADPEAAALLLPAVQAAREAARKTGAEADDFRFALVDIDGDGEADAGAVWKAPANVKDAGGETLGWAVFEGNDENVFTFTATDDLFV